MHSMISAIIVVEMLLTNVVGGGGGGGGRGGGTEAKEKLEMEYILIGCSLGLFLTLFILVIKYCIIRKHMQEKRSEDHAAFIRMGEAGSFEKGIKMNQQLKIP